VGGGKEAFGAPKGIVEVGAMAFQLRRQTAIDDAGAASLVEKIRYQRRHFDTGKG
jgi:hypothetical protein